MSEDAKLTAVKELVEHVAQQQHPLYPAASETELLDITVRHLIEHVEGRIDVRDEEQAEYWYLKTYQNELARERGPVGERGCDRNC